MTLEERNKIREKYKTVLPIIEKLYPRLSPYFHDWQMTPIEESVWYDIRILMLPFYPQFPIGPYFVDFADPVKKIVIEVDGKDFHQDKAKDEKRQSEIEKLGWSVWRISGSESFRQYRKSCFHCGNPTNFNRDTESFLIMSKIADEYYDRPHYIPEFCEECLRSGEWKLT